MVEASFPCRSELGRAVGDMVSLYPTAGGRVVLMASREGGSTTISVHLSPEDILQFAQVALQLADEIAEREIS